jgi:MFS family permease
LKPSRYRYLVVSIFFFFMLLHQSDKLLIGPLTTPIMETFDINEAQMGAVFTGALLVGALLFPVWGFLYDRFARPKLLALASFIWGSTTWLSAIAPTYPAFVVTRASTGIDDSSYPGIFSLIADYFSPKSRGKVYGLLQLTQPLGYMMGMILALILGQAIGWRGVFYITGTLGVLLAFVIYFGVRDVPRGRSEPELAEVEHLTAHRFEWQTVKKLFSKRTLLFLYVQGFFGVFPWNVITYWFFRYLETERDYDETAVLITMSIAILFMTLGYAAGGAAGDYMFKRTPRGRILVSTVGVIMGAIFLALALNTPNEQQILFAVIVSAASFFMPFASPNVIASVYDVTLPEVRSTALSVQYAIESAGAALAPFIAGVIATKATLGVAILVVSISAWILDALFFVFTAKVIPADIDTLRSQLRQRAQEEKAAASTEPSPDLA